MSDEEKFAQLAELRLGMHADEIARILPDEWVPPGPGSFGHFHLIRYPKGTRPQPIFGARITTTGHIGRLNFYGGFPEHIKLAGLNIGMALDDVRRQYRDAFPDPAESMPAYGVEAFRTNRLHGLVLIFKMREGRLIAVEFERSGSVYPGDMQQGTGQKVAGMRAHDLELQHRPVDPNNNQGWVFGLPPGIGTEQWPLDPVTGYPLMHGFTLLLPAEYRVHGPEFAAISFFATAPDHNTGAPNPNSLDELRAAVVGGPPAPGENRHLRPFRDHAKTSHPRLHRLRDVFDYEYAVILLTMAEFRGAPCLPPVFADNPYLLRGKRPQWLETGTGFACFEALGGTGVRSSYAHKLLGGEPARRLDWHRAITVSPRAMDPNAGIRPVDVEGEVEPGGYQPYYYFEGDEISEDSYRVYPWAAGHKPNHIGGTMRPMQATPAFSPYYIEFEEYFGGYNFGGGNAQLDFLEMKFDWASG